jgi:hypothetical protein
VTTRRSHLDEDDVRTIDGVRVTTALRTAFELLRTPPLLDAVAAVDVMLNARLVALHDLAAYFEARRGWSGVRLARRALRLADSGAECRWSHGFA